MHILRAFLGGLVGSVLAVQLLLASTVSAAGNAVVSVEISPAAAQTNSNVSLRFYVTPSGAGIYSTEFTVNLSNLTYVSYSASGTAFNGSSQVRTGGSAGSTSFSILAAHQGDGSSTSRAYIGQVTARTSASSGTGAVNISGIEALDHNLENMSVSAQNRTVAIAAPAVQNPNPGGGGSAPPVPSNPGNNNAPTTPSGNITSNPNPNSTVAVPSSSGSDEPDIISETELASALDPESGGSRSSDDQIASSPFASIKNLDFKKTGLIVGILLAIAAIAYFGKRFWSIRKNSVFKAPSTMPAQDSQSPVSPAPSTQTPAAPAPPATPSSSGPISQEPVIISPQTPPEQTNQEASNGPEIK